MKFPLIAGFMDGLRPIKRLTVDKWSDKNVRLTTENSAEPGPYRTARFPFLRAIYADLSPTSLVMDVTAMKGVQLGFTTAALNVAGCYIDIDPCSIMYIMPTIKLAEDISKDRFMPMVENSPSLMKRIGNARSRDSGNTISAKKFPGGRLYFSGANSAASLRSKPVRVLLTDEVDAFPMDVEDEGSPLSLAENRQVTFGSKKKLFKLSTPTTKGKSVIEFEIEKTDYRKYFIPCPLDGCGVFQHLQFSQLKWEQDNPENAWYECEHCGGRIDERHKPWFLEHGQWIATKPENAHPTRTGYHINSLYSPLGMYSWSQVAVKYTEALKDPSNALMKAFVNSTLGETWEEQGDAPEWERLFNRRSNYQINTVPTNEIAMLTAGVDIQKDRIEVEIVGWVEGKIQYSIDYRVLEGDTSSITNPVWAKLAQVVNERWRRPDGAEMPLRRMAVDSGHAATVVYEFCLQHTIAVPIKGEGEQKVILNTPKAIHVDRNGRRVGNIRLWHVGVSLLKTELYGWLNSGLNEDGTPPDGYCYFPEYGSHYFQMLTAEKYQVTKNKKGFYVYAWVLPSHVRNEALDCRVYARAAAAMEGIDRFSETDWAMLRVSYSPAVEIESPKRKSRGILGDESIWDR